MGGPGGLGGGSLRGRDGYPPSDCLIQATGGGVCNIDIATWTWNANALSHTLKDADAQQQADLDIFAAA